MRRTPEAHHIIVTSDWHLDAYTAGVERFDDIVEAVKQPIVKARELGPSCLFVFAGDLSDPDSTSVHRAVEFLARVGRENAEKGVRSVFIRGNHDVVEDGTDTSTLTPIAGAFGSGGSLVKVIEQPETIRFGGKSILCLPYPSRAKMYTPSNVESETQEWFATIGHLAVEGARMGSESDDLARGRDVAFPWEVNADILVNGHYHEAQVVRHLVRGTSQALYIPGAPVRLTFGELHHTPSYLHMQWSANGYRADHVPIANARSLKSVDESLFHKLVEDHVIGIDHREKDHTALVRIVVPSDATEAEAAIVRRLYDDAAGIVMQSAPRSAQKVNTARESIDAPVTHTSVRKTVLELAEARGGQELRTFVDGVLDDAGVP